MNYIARLQTDLAAAQAELAAMRGAIQDLRVHLDADKFRGLDPDGLRRDWIATADVWAWTSRILDAGS